MSSIFLNSFQLVVLVLTETFAAEIIDAEAKPDEQKNYEYRPGAFAAACKRQVVGELFGMNACGSRRKDLCGQFVFSPKNQRAALKNPEQSEDYPIAKRHVKIIQIAHVK